MFLFQFRFLIIVEKYNQDADEHGIQEERPTRCPERGSDDDMQCLLVLLPDPAAVGGSHLKSIFAGGEVGESDILILVHVIPVFVYPLQLVRIADGIRRGVAEGDIRQGERGSVVRQLERFRIFDRRGGKAVPVFFVVWNMDGRNIYRGREGIFPEQRRVERQHAVYRPHINRPVGSLVRRTVIELCFMQPIRISKGAHGIGIGIEPHQPVGGGQPEKMILVFHDPVNDIAGQSVLGGDPVEGLRFPVEQGKAVHRSHPDPLFGIFKDGGGIVASDALRFVRVGGVMFHFILITQVMVDAAGRCRPDIPFAVFVDLPDQGIDVIPAAERFRPVIIKHDPAAGADQEFVIAGLVETEYKVIVERIAGRFARVTFDDFPGRNVEYVYTFIICTHPETVAVGQQSVDVGCRQRVLRVVVRVVGDLPGCRVVAVDAVILCSQPQVAVLVGHDFADRVARQLGVRLSADEMVEPRVLFRQVADTAEE